jgi:hypothetical protein
LAFIKFKLCSNVTQVVLGDPIDTFAHRNEHDTLKSPLFPLPPPEKSENPYSAASIIHNSVIFVICFIEITIFVVLSSFAPTKRFLQPIFRMVEHPSFEWAKATISLPLSLFQLLIAGRTWYLTNWTAVDDFVDQCMSEKVCRISNDE